MHSFTLCGPCHLGALATIGLLCACAVFVLKKWPDGKASRTVIWTISLLCFSSYPLSILTWLYVGPPYMLEYFLPFHLCNVVSIIAGIALLTRKALLCELSFYWGLAGTLQGLITPALVYDFPHPVFLQFFLLHGIVVIAALVLPLGLGWRPRFPIHKTIHRAFLLINLYTVSVIALNFAIGSNFGYLNAKPETASLLDHFGPWPIYILPMELMAYGLFWGFSLPFLLRQQSNKKLS